ncbi:MAG TPA: hypothetical protein PLB41_05435 [Rubrivivax sp.]|nr:hypothetical protein [Rubrivivax sp.]HPO17768.1 hypothetical protein [Rubrivivax sp.]
MRNASIKLAAVWRQRQEQPQHRGFEPWPWLGAACTARPLGSGWQGLRALLALPFDLARHQHAAGVRAGALPRSMLESQRFEQQLGLLESLSLGPLARRP